MLSSEPFRAGTVVSKMKEKSFVVVLISFMQIFSIVVYSIIVSDRWFWYYLFPKLNGNIRDMVRVTVSLGSCLVGIFDWFSLNQWNRALSFWCQTLRRHTFGHGEFGIYFRGVGDCVKDACLYWIIVGGNLCLCDHTQMPSSALRLAKFEIGAIGIHNKSRTCDELLQSTPKEVVNNR